VNRRATDVVGIVLVLVVPWCFGLFSSQGLSIARFFPEQLSFYEVRMSVSRVFMLILMRIFYQSYNAWEMFVLMCTTFIILKDHMLVSKMYW